MPTDFSLFISSSFTGTATVRLIRYNYRGQYDSANHKTRWNNLTIWKWCECDPDSGGCITYAQLPVSASPHCACLSAIHKQHRTNHHSICSPLLQGTVGHRKCRKESTAHSQGGVSIVYITVPVGISSRLCRLFISVEHYWVRWSRRPKGVSLEYKATII